MEKIYGMCCSSGKRFGKQKEIKKSRAGKKISQKQADFIRQCPAYGLTPDFYHALCLDADGEEYFLEGFAGEYCELSGGLVGMLKDVKSVLGMLMASCEQELKELPEVAELLSGGDDEATKKLISEGRKDINQRKRCIETAEKYANPDMPEIFTEMGVTPFPGVKHYGAVYEFVSYNPKEGYVLENLGRDRYDPKRYLTVTFEALKNGLIAFAGELCPSEATKWLHMASEVKPADMQEEAPVSGQMFFAF